MTIEGRVACATPGSFAVTFRNAAGDTVAVAERGSRARGGGLRARVIRAKRRHDYRMTCSDGSVLWIETGTALSRMRRGDGSDVGSLLHTGTVTAVAEPGGTVFHVVPDFAAPRAGNRSQLVILDRMGSALGRMIADIDRAGDIDRAADDFDPATGAGAAATGGVDAAGRVDRLGVRCIRVSVVGMPDRGERDLLLGACVDLADEPRCYGADAT